MTLPAHRFEDRKNGDGDARTWVFDYDGTVTSAPDQMARIATGLKALGDQIIVLTGNQAPKADLVKQLGDYGFPFDDLVQYEDDGSNGIARAEHLDQFDAWGAFDNRIDRAYTFAKVCPHLYLIVKPSGDDKDNAKGTKKDAKKAAKKLSRSEHRSAAPAPPDYRPADKPGESCGTCVMHDAAEGVCWGYGNTPVETDHVCDSWSPETDTP